MYRGEVQILRSNLRFGLGNLAEALETSTGSEIGTWWWNDDFIPQGRYRSLCSYGPMYQVFLAHGIDLHSVRDNEIRALEIAVSSGLLPTAALMECRDSYGLG